MKFHMVKTGELHGQHDMPEPSAWHPVCEDARAHARTVHVASIGRR